MALAAACLLALQSAASPAFFADSTTLPAPTPNAAPHFGTAVAYQNGRLVIGAPYDGGQGLYAGAVHVYEASNGFSQPVQTLYASDAQPLDTFGRQVALSGDTLAVTNLQVSSSYYVAFTYAYVYVFERQGGNWVETQKLDQVGDGWTSLALEDSTLLLGDRTYYNHAVNELDSGIVHAYERSGSTWNLKASITPQIPYYLGYFGTSVALDGDRFATTGPSLTPNKFLYVFERPGGTWTEVASLATTGESVDLDGDRLVVGAPKTHLGTTIWVGEVHVYEFDGQTWNQTATLQHPSPAKQHEFGTRVLLDGSLLLVTTPGEKPGGTVQVFRETGGTWTWTSTIRPADVAKGDRFGSDLALDGASLAVGAAGDTLIATSNSGSVRLFDGGDHETYCTAGTSGAGCRALLSVSGSASASAPSGFTVTASSVQGDRRGYFFFGTSGRQAAPWGKSSSYQCVVPPVKRAGLSPKQGTPGQCDASHAVDLNALWATKPNKNPGPGALVQTQFWYRDPNNTSNQTTSLSDAVEAVVQP